MSKILVIDDGESIRDLISGLLTNAGHDVVTAKDGEEGLKRFNESYFDLVITDLVMPKCNGDEVARHVHNAGRKIPVVGITATPWEVDQNYFDVVIEKPFTLEEFTECIKSIIQDGKSV
jgi:CheY-like chemotaxis protein